MTQLDDISDILAIRFGRLGDVVLLLPALGRIKSAFPGARLTLATGARCAPIAGMCPFLDEVIPVDRVRMRDSSRLAAIRDIFRLVRQLRERRYDLVVDFHSFRETNLLAWSTGARYRLGMKRADRAYLPFCFNLEPAPEDKSLHVAEMFEIVAEHVPGVSRLAGLSLASPAIAVPPEIAMRVAARNRRKPVVAMYVGASVPERRWPASRFGELASALLDEWNASVIILSGVSDAETRIARQVLASSSGCAELLAGLSVPELAGEIAAADLMVSNDSGPMHMGSALGVPTLGIFSSSLPIHYRPKGVRDRSIRRERIDDVQVGEVLELIREMRVATIRGRRP